MKHEPIPCPACGCTELYAMREAALSGSIGGQKSPVWGGTAYICEGCGNTQFFVDPSDLEYHKEYENVQKVTATAKR